MKKLPVKLDKPFTDNYRNASQALLHELCLVLNTTEQELYENLPNYQPDPPPNYTKMPPWRWEEILQGKGTFPIRSDHAFCVILDTIETIANSLRDKESANDLMSVFWVYANEYFAMNGQEIHIPPRRDGENPILRTILQNPVKADFLQKFQKCFNAIPGANLQDKAFTLKETVATRNLSPERIVSFDKINLEWVYKGGIDLFSSNFSTLIVGFIALATNDGANITPQQLRDLYSAWKANDKMVSAEQVSYDHFDKTVERKIDFFENKLRNSSVDGRHGDRVQQVWQRSASLYLG